MASTKDDTSKTRECAVINSSHLMGKKWTIALLTDIRGKRFKGFNRFAKKAGLTSTMLSRQLKGLETEGLLAKIPESPGYLLTEKGRDFCELIDYMKKWNIKWNSVSKICLDASCTECGLLSPESRPKYQRGNAAGRTVMKLAK